DDLSALLPLGQLESLALPGEAYKLAFTDSLLDSIYEGRVNESLLVEGGYIRDEIGWWIPSGRVLYSPGHNDTPETELSYARHRFFLPRRFRNPFGAVTTVTSDPYDLLTLEMIDAVGNTITAGERDEDGLLVVNGNDYRVLQPRLVM